MTFKKEIASARAFLGSDNIEKIIKLCHLYPKNSWDVWQDEAGNTLKLSQVSRKVLSRQSKKQTLTTSDLYRKSHPSQIAKISSWGLIADDGRGMVTYLALLLGKDGRLRGVLFREGLWIENTYPILAGYNLLSIVASGYKDCVEREHSTFLIPNRFGFEPSKIFTTTKVAEIVR